jgi:DNA repair exonuclease SbcCD ATPase subunit
MSSFQIHSMRWRNFFSFGNGWTELDFDQGTSTLISGVNGSGKSTIYEVIFFCLYGKPFRKIKKGAITNWVNEKDCEVEMEASRDGQRFKIRRTVSPATIKVWVDDIPRDQEASNKDPQDWLERAVIGMSERTFRQIVILGSTSYIPFMSLSPADRRVVVEDILGLGVYAEMLLLAKKRLTDVTKDIAGLTTRHSNLSGRRDELQNSVNRLSVSNTATSDRMQLTLETVKVEVADLKEKCTKVADTLKAAKTKVNPEKQVKLVEAMEVLQTGKAALFVQDKQFVHQLEFFSNNHICPTCDQSITEELRDKKVTEFSQKIGLIKPKLDKLIDLYEQTRLKNIELTNLENNVTKLGRDLSTLIELMKSKKSQENVIFEQLNSIKDIGETELVAAKASLESVVSEADELKTEIESCIESHAQLEAIVKSLKDDGVKARVIREFLPMINRLIAKWLSAMELKVSFKFDEQFEETILVRSRQEYSYDSFSTGERLRMDLALLFAWREIAVLRGFSGSGLVVFDEIGGGSLDPEGFSSFVRAIEIARDNGDCVLVISHQPDLLSDRCDRILSVTKVSGFSKISATNESREAILS